MHAPFPARPLNLPRRKPTERPADMFAPARPTTPAPDRPYTILGHEEDAGGLLQDRLYLEEHRDGHVAVAPRMAGHATLHRRDRGYAIHYPPLGRLYVTQRMLRLAIGDGSIPAGDARIPDQMALGVRLGWDARDVPGTDTIRRYRVEGHGDLLLFTAEGVAE